MMKVDSIKPQVTDIDTTHAFWRLEVGDRTRRSLIRYFLPRVKEAVLNYEPPEWETSPPKRDMIVDMEPVEALAWELAEEVIQAVDRDVGEYLDAFEVVDMTPQEALERVLPEVVEEVESERLKMDPLNLELAVTFDRPFNLPMTFTTK